MKFKILLAAFIFATATFANEMCTELCASCENSTDASCSKVEELCACSVAKQKIENFNKEIAATILKCDSAYCSYEIKTIDDSIAVFKRVQVKMRNLDTTKVELSEPVEEISSECSDMCSSCNKNFENGTCARIETICKCTYFLELEAKKAEQHAQDSIAKIEASLARIETANVLGKIILDTCDTAKICNVYFTVNNQNMQIVDIKKKEIKPKEPVAKVDTIAKPAPVIVATPNTYLQKKDTLKAATPRKKQIFYTGLYLSQGFYDFSGDYNYLTNSMYEVDVGFLMRWYFYKYGSFQMGINGLFDWTDESDIDRVSNSSYNSSLYFYSLGLEFPISLKFGLPFKCSPYLSLNMFIRKPIYRWVIWSNDKSDDYEVFENNAGQPEDFEFLWTFGFGLEINRFVSIELQWLIESLRTSPSAVSPYENMNALSRIQVNFAW